MPTRTVKLAVVASCLAVTGCTGGARSAGVSEVDTQPVDWSKYERMWVKGFPRASADEPRLATYDPLRAEAFLTDIAVRFSRRNKCATCHTNVPYLMAEPLFKDYRDDAAVAEVRAILLDNVAELRLKPEASPWLPFIIAPVVSALVVHDSVAGEAMDRRTRELFDQLWTLQRAEGNWSYPLNTLLPLLERDRTYMAMLVALAVGYAPPWYRATPATRKGLGKLQALFRGNPPRMAHDKAVLLWASVRTPGLLDTSEQSGYQRDLLQLQNADGGWALTAMGRWPRHDGAPNDTPGPSDGYATGLAALALCESGVRPEIPGIRRAIAWLKTNERASGRWFTRSTYSDHFYNYLSNMATAYALMAVGSCSRLTTDTFALEATGRTAASAQGRLSPQRIAP